jgi:hypothetical protein
VRYHQLLPRRHVLVTVQAQLATPERANPKTWPVIYTYLRWTQRGAERTRARYQAAGFRAVVSTLPG